MTKRLAAVLLFGSLLAGPPAARAQTIEVMPAVTRATVGDPVLLRLRIRLGEGDQLLDSVAQPHGELESGARVLSYGTLSRTAERIFEGQVRVAFYRTGTQTVPTLELSYRRGAVILHGTMLSEAATVEITPVLPAGNPPLKDLKDLEPAKGFGLLPLGLALATILLAAYLLVRWRRRKPPAVALAERELVPAAVAPNPYQAALDRLAALERERWPARGDVTRHYAAAIDVLREYLEEAEDVRARERTTSELLWALPPHLSDGSGPGGLREACRDVLVEADLVKFAKVRPSAAEAAAFLDDMRDLLRRWQAGPSDAAPPATLAVAPADTMSHAVR